MQKASGRGETFSQTVYPALPNGWPLLKQNPYWPVKEGHAPRHKNEAGRFQHKSISFWGFIQIQQMLGLQQQDLLWNPPTGEDATHGKSFWRELRDWVGCRSTGGQSLVSRVKQSWRNKNFPEIPSRTGVLERVVFMIIMMLKKPFSYSFRWNIFWGLTKTEVLCFTVGTQQQTSQTWSSGWIPRWILCYIPDLSTLTTRTDNLER